jgi:hypothetical protein
MELDNEKIDDTVLALLLLGLHDGARVWKEFDWDAMNRLHEKGLISDPHGKTRAVVLTEDGLHRAERLLEELFLPQRGTANQRYEHIYAIVRYDRFLEASEQSFTVKEVVRTQAMAEAEVNRLNELNADKNSTYFWQATRLFSEGQSAGHRRGEMA